MTGCLTTANAVSDSLSGVISPLRRPRKNILQRGEISDFPTAVYRAAVTASRVSVVERIVSREYVQTTCP